MKALSTSIHIAGRTGRTVITTTIYGNTKRVVVEYPDGTADVLFSKIK